jgi:hypothetical protein
MDAGKQGIGGDGGFITMSESRDHLSENSHYIQVSTHSLSAVIRHRSHCAKLKVGIKMGIMCHGR